MSSDAVGWAFRHSPHKGTAFTVHLAIADSVNDQNGNEFWMKLGRLAGKARTTRPTASAIIGDLIQGGFLTLLEEGGGRSRPSRYRFEFPEVPVAFESRTVSRDDSLSETVSRGDAKLSAEMTGKEPKENPKSSSRTQVDAGFTDFWAEYPLKKGKVAALKAYEKAVKAATAIDALSDRDHAIWKINNAARAYAVQRRGQDPKFTAHPTTWLNQGRWDDDDLKLGPHLAPDPSEYDNIRYV